MIILNTCTVTASGDSRMHTALRRLRAGNPDAVMVLTGCFAQAFPKEAAALPEADLVIGTQDRDRLPQLVQQFLMGNRAPMQHIPAYTGTEAFACLPHHLPADRTRAFLKDSRRLQLLLQLLHHSLCKRSLPLHAAGCPATGSFSVCSRGLHRNCALRYQPCLLREKNGAARCSMPFPSAVKHRAFNGCGWVR